MSTLRSDVGPGPDGIRCRIGDMFFDGRDLSDLFVVSLLVSFLFF